MFRYNIFFSLPFSDSFEKYSFSDTSFFCFNISIELDIFFRSLSSYSWILLIRNSKLKITCFLSVSFLLTISFKVLILFSKNSFFFLKFCIKRFPSSCFCCKEIKSFAISLFSFWRASFLLFASRNSLFDLSYSERGKSIDWAAFSISEILSWISSKKIIRLHYILILQTECQINFILLWGYFFQIPATPSCIFLCLHFINL